MKWCTYSILFCLLLHVAHCDDRDDDTTIEIEEDQQDDVTYVSPDPPPGAFFAEHFDDSKKFSKKWIKSQAKKEDIDDDIAKYDGLWQLEAAERDALAGDLGLVLKSKAKHAAISAKLDRLFQFDTKPLVVQYEVNLQNGQECGGSYLKLLADSPVLDLKTFHDKTPYIVMFGPDKCGNDYKLHFIFQHKNPKNGTMSEKHAKRPNQRVEEPFKDKKPHLYRLVVHPDNSYEISVDNQVMNSGSLLEDFTPPVNPPKEIDDPSDYKPEDWDEREKIPDPEAAKPADWDEDAPPKISDPSATKPEGWLDDEPQMIGDPDAQKPEDWDDEMDGDWEAPLIDNPKCSEAPGCGKWSAPMIDNPNFKGKWRAPLINNPTYKGKWKPNRIPNPDYFHDDQPFKMGSIAAIGFELWSMSDSILFDNVIITDSVAEAQAWAEQTFTLKQRKSDKNAGGMLRRFLRYSNERPWLWAVYVVLIGLPSVLLIAYCCSSTKKDDDEGEAKKTDKVTPDDPIKEEPTKDAELLEQEDEESGEEEEKVEVPEDGDEPEELEEEVDETPDDSEKVDDAVEVPDETGDAPKSPRRRRTRKD